MPKKPIRPIFTLLQLSLFFGLAACTPPPPQVQEDWQKRTLIAGPDVNVRVLRRLYFERIHLEWPAGSMSVTDATGTSLGSSAETQKIFLKKQQQHLAVMFQPSLMAGKQAPTYDLIRLSSNRRQVEVVKISIPELNFYRDYEAKAIEISVKYGCLALVHVVPLELYLARVLPAEMDPNHFAGEALKAQAIVARTWALKNAKRHRRFGYDFCDGPHCQVYRGRKFLSQRAELTVKQTSGEVLTFQGHLAQAFYHSTCGGNTVFVEDVWGNQAFPYLIRVEDSREPEETSFYCARSPYAQWQLLTSLRLVERILQQQHILTQKENLQDICVDTVNRSGRVTQLLIVTNQRQITLAGEAFRRLLNSDFGQRKILSRCFEIQLQGHQFSIHGHGLGHGVGMCQWGARGMAQKGFSYQEILSHYFSGTQLGKWYRAPEEETLGWEASTSNSATGRK